VNFHLEILLLLKKVMERETRNAVARQNWKLSKEQQLIARTRCSNGEKIHEDNSKVLHKL